MTKSFKDNFRLQGANPAQVAHQARLVPRKLTSKFTCKVEDAKELPDFFKKWRHGGYSEFMAYCAPKKDSNGDFIEGIIQCDYGRVTCDTGAK